MVVMHRTRGWRRLRAVQQQKNQTVLYQSVYGREFSGAAARWKKQHALGCHRANCGFCRNPRFNRNSQGSDRLTLSEHRILISYREWLSEL